MKAQFVNVGEDPKHAMPPPQSVASFAEIVQSVNVGEEPMQKTPPPFDAVLPVIVQSANVGKELRPQKTPPPEPAILPVIVQSVNVGEEPWHAKDDDAAMGHIIENIKFKEKKDHRKFSSNFRCAGKGGRARSDCHRCCFELTWEGIYE